MIEMTKASEYLIKGNKCGLNHIIRSNGFTLRESESIRNGVRN